VKKEDFQKIREKLKTNWKRLMDEFYEFDDNFIENKIYILKTDNELDAEVFFNKLNNLNH
jgi:hypothetical protein